MASNKVNLGIGLATGMFYTAPAGTTLPAYPSASLTSWTEVGAVSADGITWSGIIPTRFSSAQEVSERPTNILTLIERSS